MEWISVEERLPEYYLPILFFANYSAFGFYESSYNSFVEVTSDGMIRHHKDTVTHWMPLPPPPEK